jgi:RNA polymerase sigma-70 factor (ECF subfamily)
MAERCLDQRDAARLLTRHHAALYGYIYACVRSHHDAEDILQNVSVVVIESLADLRDEAGFLPWAREIARRCSLAHCRKQRRTQTLDPELVERLADAADALEREADADDHREALLACLERLPPASRDLLSRRYDGAGGAAGALAARFGRSVQGIYAQIKRIKAALRDCVARRLATEPSR